MSGPSSANVQGLSPSEPPLPLLSSLSTAIQTSIQEYESAKSLAEKASALQKIQAASTKLSRSTTPLPMQLMQINFGPNLNVAIRIALEMGLFEALPQQGNITVQELASKTNSDEEFLLRIIRVFVAFDMLLSSESPKGQQALSHTPFTRFLCMPAAKASTKHLFDNMLQAQTKSAGSYYQKHGFKSPDDSKDSPFSFSHGMEGMNIFDILETMPDRMALFNSAMMITTTFGLDQVVSLYPFDELAPNSDGIALVDVGGGKGHIINEISKRYPNMKGKIALEDMKVVLDGGTVVSKEVVLQNYDFFKEEQPIKGSNYFLKAILHDWPDSSCLQILSKLVPAMRGSPNSRLLICDLVLPDRNPEAGKVLRDINMLCIGGKERSLRQWKSLLGQGGFKILKVWGSEHGASNIVEAALDE